MGQIGVFGEGFDTFEHPGGAIVYASESNDVRSQTAQRNVRFVD
jgi:hypothetical protein